MLRFNDGVSVDTSGPLRPLRLADGWYVVGEGMMIAVASANEARATIVEMSRPTDCRACDGEGQLHYRPWGRHEGWHNCPYCGGSGKERRKLGGRAR